MKNGAFLELLERACYTVVPFENNLCVLSGGHDKVMVNVLDRQQDILSMVRSLDITKTMEKNAKEKYEAITDYLKSTGVEASMYAQGSFALGTVVRPHVKNEDAAYDLDVICQLAGDKTKFTPDGLRDVIQNALQESGLYQKKLKVCAECFTIEYADVDGVAFTIDIVPATSEKYEEKLRLALKCDSPQLLATAIAIPKQKMGRGTWLTNNPKGLKCWFDSINAPFAEEQARKSMKKSRTLMSASVEKIPQYSERSALQRVIQILKCHRDAYYSAIDDGDELKPASVIITVMVSQVARHCMPTDSVFELLQAVLDELNIYSLHQKLSSDDFAVKYGERNVFTHKTGNWCLRNPANPEDNLTDHWKDNEKIPQKFFCWLATAKKDLCEALQEQSDEQFGVTLENGFGHDLVSRTIGDKYRKKEIMAPRVITTQNVGKPYRQL